MTSETCPNPAERLLNIVREYRTQYSKHGNQTHIVILQAALKASDDDFSVRFAELTSLILEVERCVAADADIQKKARYLAWKQPFKQFVSPRSLMQPANAFQPLVQEDSTIVHTLEFCSEALAKSFGESLIEEADLAALSLLTDNLFDSIKAEVADANLKLLLLELVEGIRHAIALYQIRGPQGIRDAIEKLTGSLVMYKDLFAQNRETAPSTYESLAGLLQKGAEIVEKANRFASAMKSLAATVGPFLPLKP